MNIQVTKTPTQDTRIIFLIKESKQKPFDFEGNKDEITVRYEKTNTIIYCGLGELKKCDNTTIRSSAAAGIRKAVDLKRKKASIIEPDILHQQKLSATALVEGAILGNYTFVKYKNKKTEPLSLLEFSGSAFTLKEAKSTATLCANSCYARDLVNTNANEISPAFLAQEAKNIARKSNAIVCTILTEKEIKAQGLGLLYAVGQGSPYPPRLIIMAYTGDPRSKIKTAIVGKGITFDSGGQNLKPSKHIETMRCDMAGAAAVLGIMKSLDALRPKCNVIGVIAAAQNAIDGTSYFPGDVHTAFNGTTIEILNTDAEGRLALADGISYCIKHWKPTEIIDLATLTGSIVMALGDTIAGLFSNNDALAEKLFRSGEKCGERLWRMPLRDEHREAMKSDIADLRNISKLPAGHAGSLTGAAFIEAFVEDTPWAHCDIAGTAFNEGEASGEIPKYGTGFGVRLLMDYLTQR